MNVHDPRDPTSLLPETRARILSSLGGPLRASRLVSSPLRIGVPLEYNIEELSPSVRRAWFRALSHLKGQGHTIHAISLPATKLALSAYYVLAPAEASSNLARYDGVRYGARHDGEGGARYLYASTRGQTFGSEVKRRVLLGTFSLSADSFENYFIQAQRVRRLVQRDFDAAFRADDPLTSFHHPGAHGDTGVDVLVCPTAASAPPRLSNVVSSGEDGASPLDAYLTDVFTVPASLAGLPAVSVPASPEELVPIGLQVIGQYGDDDLVLKVGEVLQGRKKS